MSTVSTVKGGLSVLVATAAAVVFASAAAASPTSAPLPPSPAITPGAGLVASNPAGEGINACTAGFLAHTAAGQQVMFTAGHCDAGAKVWMKWTATGAYELIGLFAKSIYEGEYQGEADMGLVALNSPIPTDVRIMDRIPVVGSTDDVKVGDQLCKYGVPTGFRCGRVLEPPALGEVHFDAQADNGDSGGPVYLVRPNGDALAVGIAIGHADAGGTVAELVQPYLQKWSLTLDTIPAPAATASGSGR